MNVQFVAKGLKEKERDREIENSKSALCVKKLLLFTKQNDRKCKMKLMLRSNTLNSLLVRTNIF